MRRGTVIASSGKGGKASMGTFTGRYEFSYDTPGVDAEGNATLTPTTLAIGGVSEDVARGIRAGLRKVASITNVSVARVMEDRENVTNDPTA